MNNASWFGHGAVLYWCKESKFEMRWNFDMKWTDNAIDWASQNEHVEVLNWWKDSGLEMRWTKSAVYFAVQKCHVAVLEWWRESELIPRECGGCLRNQKLAKIHRNKIQSSRKYFFILFKS